MRGFESRLHWVQIYHSISKFRKKLFKHYHEDIFGNLIFNFKVSNIIKDLTNTFYEKRLRHKDYRKKGFSSRLDVRHPRKKLKKFKLHGQLIIDKSKIKLFYGNLRDYQLRKYFYVAYKMDKLFANNLLTLLESRIDIILLRSNFGRSIGYIRQMIVHKGILVNYKTVTKPSYFVKAGDIITCESSMLSIYYRNVLSRFFLISNKYIYHNNYVFKFFYKYEKKFKVCSWRYRKEKIRLFLYRQYENIIPNVIIKLKRMKTLQFFGFVKKASMYKYLFNINIVRKYIGSNIIKKLRLLRIIKLNYLKQRYYRLHRPNLYKLKRKSKFLTGYSKKSNRNKLQKFEKKLVSKKYINKDNKN